MSPDLYSARPANAVPRPLQRYQRALFSVPVRFQYLMPGGIRSSRGTTLDISEGGLGAIVSGELRVGEMVEIDVAIAEATLSIVAIVRHSSSLRSGFEFVGLTEEERLQIITTTTGSA
jgi:c-di-GMP-binding flagellar brake protein YcgR